jgi:hypothetical protein
VRPSQDAEGAAAGAKTVACDYGQAIADLETAAEGLARAGHNLRELVKLDLPEFPILEFTVKAGGTSIEVELKDPDSRLQQIVDLTDTLQGLLGTMGNLHASATSLSEYLRRRHRPSQIQQRWDAFVTAGNDGSSTVSAVLNLLRDLILSGRRTSRSQAEAVAFLTDIGEIVPRVAASRQRMICAVKSGYAAFYAGTELIEQEAAELKRAIAADPSCSAGAGRMRDRLTKVLDLKLLELRRIHRWHAEGIVRPDGSPGWGYLTRNTWLDRVTTSRGTSAILEQTICATFPTRTLTSP